MAWKQALKVPVRFASGLWKWVCRELRELDDELIFRDRPVRTSLGRFRTEDEATMAWYLNESGVRYRCEPLAFIFHSSSVGRRKKAFLKGLFWLVYEVLPEETLRFLFRGMEGRRPSFYVPDYSAYIVFTPACGQAAEGDLECYERSGLSAYDGSVLLGLLKKAENPYSEIRRILASRARNRLNARPESPKA